MTKLWRLHPLSNVHACLASIWRSLHPEDGEYESLNPRYKLSMSGGRSLIKLEDTESDRYSTIIILVDDSHKINDKVGVPIYAQIKSSDMEMEDQLLKELRVDTVKTRDEAISDEFTVGDLALALLTVADTAGAEGAEKLLL